MSGAVVGVEEVVHDEEPGLPAEDVGPIEVADGGDLGVVHVVDEKADTVDEVEGDATLCG